MSRFTTLKIKYKKYRNYLTPDRVYSWQKQENQVKKLGRGKQFATGIDIGSFSVKIISLGSDDAGMVVISRITVVKLESAEKNETQEQHLQRQKVALKEALKKHGHLQGKIVIGFPRELATARYINFPSSNRDEIKEMLLFDVERHVPFAVDDLEISYQKIELINEHETRILMVCVPKKRNYAFCGHVL